MNPNNCKSESEGKSAGGAVGSAFSVSMSTTCTCCSGAPPIVFRGIINCVAMLRLNAGGMVGGGRTLVQFCAGLLKSACAVKRPYTSKLVAAFHAVPTNV